MGKWVETTIGAYCDPPQYGLNASAIKYDGEHGYIRITDIDDTSHRFIKSGITSPDEFSDEYLVKKGDVLLARTGASVGKSYVYDDRDGQLYFAGFLIRFRPKKDNDPGFLFYQTLTDRYAKWVANVSVRTGQPGINSLEYATYKFLAPVSLDEQRHIAEILMTCDEVIEKSEAVAEKYRAIKAGMLKDLFTRGIGKNGKLRPTPESAPQLYKDTALGKVPREWEEKTIAEIGDVVTGSTPSRSDSANWGGDFNWISAQDFKDKYIYNAAEKVSDKGKRACRLLPLNSVLVTCIASIGLNAIAKVECATNQQIHAVICEGCDYEYFYYLICFSDGKLKQLAGQTAVPIIGKTDFQQLLMAYPSDFAEQRQIAERLSAIDAKIADELAVIAKYRKVKAGLMARLLTPPDMEVE